MQCRGARAWAMLSILVDVYLARWMQRSERDREREAGEQLNSSTNSANIRPCMYARLLPVRLRTEAVSSDAEI